jgi:hypothetical protein
VKSEPDTDKIQFPSASTGQFLKSLTLRWPTSAKIDEVGAFISGAKKKKQIGNINKAKWPASIDRLTAAAGRRRASLTRGKKNWEKLKIEIN